MKPRKQRLDNLYFRWGQHVNMGASDVAEALIRAGIIVFDGPNHYRETETYRHLSREKFEDLVSQSLNKYSEEKSR